MQTEFFYFPNEQIIFKCLKLYNCGNYKYIGFETFKYLYDYKFGKKIYNNKTGMKERSTMKSDLFKMVGQDEKILWRSKPDKKCFILGYVFSIELLLFAIFWGVLGIIIMYFGGIQPSDINKSENHVFWVFFSPILLLVWGYIGNVLYSGKEYDNTEYIITDRGVYISGGIFSRKFRIMKPFAELSLITVHRSICDQLLNVGEIVFYSRIESSLNSNYLNEPCINMRRIKDFIKVYKLTKKLQTDIHSDTTFKNDLRQNENYEDGNKI